LKEELSIIYSRRSIRKYQTKPVPVEILTELIEAAMAAPSAVNTRPWEFVVITQAKKLEQVKKVLKHANYDSPAGIVVCGKPAAAFATPDGNFMEQDCAAATENILIAASGLGLGTVWTAIYPDRNQVKNVSMELNLPQGVVPFAFVLVGYPAEEKPARTQFDPKALHWESY